MENILKKNIVILFLFIITNCVVHAQKVKLGKTINVTNNHKAYAETMIAVDPTNAKNMVLGVIKIDSFNDKIQYNISCYISFDGGKNWQESILPKEKNQVLSFDPSVLFSKDGIVYMCYSVTIKGKGGPKLMVHRSSNKGKDWDNTTIINSRTSDHPHLTMDNEGSIYISSWGIDRDPLLKIENPVGQDAVILAKSTDRGETFEVNGVSFNNDLGLGVYKPVVFPNGKLWLPFSQFSKKVPKNKSHVYVLNTLKKKTKIEDTDLLLEFQRRFPSSVSAALDLSKRFYGRLYMTYINERQNRREMVVKYSENQGKTWSAPAFLKVVNKGSNIRLHTISISKKGVIGVAWVQNEVKEEKCWKVYLSYSNDGGNSFSNPISLSDDLSCSDTKENLQVGNGFMSRRFPYGGDYIGLDDTDKGFQVAWVDLSLGYNQVFTRHIEILN